MTKKDIRISTRIVGFFITIKAGFVALLALYIIIKQGVAATCPSGPSTRPRRPLGGLAS